MKTNETPLQPLKWFLNFIFIIVLITIGLNIIGILFIPFFPESKIVADLILVPNFKLELPIIGLFITAILLNIGFIFSLYVFKKIVSSLFKSPLFTEFQISSLKLLGQLIVLLVIIKSVFNIFSDMIFGKSEVVGIHIFSFDSKLMAICMGLFFIYLSYVFRKAKGLKEENDLTV
jgi:hypothetical protein